MIIGLFKKHDTSFIGSIETLAGLLLTGNGGGR
jgi:hypothetical protein